MRVLLLLSVTLFHLFNLTVPDKVVPPETFPRECSRRGTVLQCSRPHKVNFTKLAASIVFEPQLDFLLLKPSRSFRECSCKLVKLAKKLWTSDIVVFSPIKCSFFRVRKCIRGEKIRYPVQATGLIVSREDSRLGWAIGKHNAKLWSKLEEIPRRQERDIILQALLSGLNSTIDSLEIDQELLGTRDKTLAQHMNRQNLTNQSLDDSTLKHPVHINRSRGVLSHYPKTHHPKSENVVQSEILEDLHMLQNMDSAQTASLADIDDMNSSPELRKTPEELDLQATLKHELKAIEKDLRRKGWKKKSKKLTLTRQTETNKKKKGGRSKRYIKRSDGVSLQKKRAGRICFHCTKNNHGVDFNVSCTGDAGEIFVFLNCRNNKNLSDVYNPRRNEENVNSSAQYKNDTVCNYPAQRVASHPTSAILNRRHNILIFVPNENSEDNGVNVTVKGIQGKIRSDGHYKYVVCNNEWRYRHVSTKALVNDEFVPRRSNGHKQKSFPFNSAFSKTSSRTKRRAKSVQLYAVPYKVSIGGEFFSLFDNLQISKALKEDEESAKLESAEKNSDLRKTMKLQNAVDLPLKLAGLINSLLNKGKMDETLAAEKEGNDYPGFVKKLLAEEPINPIGLPLESSIFNTTNTTEVGVAVAHKSSKHKKQDSPEEAEIKQYRRKMAERDRRMKSFIVFFIAIMAIIAIIISMIILAVKEKRIKRDQYQRLLNELAARDLEDIQGRREFNVRQKDSFVDDQPWVLDLTTQNPVPNPTISKASVRSARAASSRNSQLHENIISMSARPASSKNSQLQENIISPFFENSRKTHENDRLPEEIMSLQQAYLQTPQWRPKGSPDVNGQLHPLKLKRSDPFSEMTDKRLGGRHVVSEFSRDFTHH